MPTNIIIRNAVQKDLSAMFDLDEIVTYEYFLPIFIKGYAHLPLGKNPVYFIELELEIDKERFIECVNGEAESLWVACDQDENSLIL